jgi:hypothetical protein
MVNGILPNLAFENLAVGRYGLVVGWCRLASTMDAFLFEESVPITYQRNNHCWSE